MKYNLSFESDNDSYTPSAHSAGFASKKAAIEAAERQQRVAMRDYPEFAGYYITVTDEDGNQHYSQVIK